MDNYPAFGETAGGEALFFVEEGDVDSMLEAGARLIFDRMQRAHQIPLSLDFFGALDYITSVHDGVNADGRDYPVDASLEDIILGYAEWAEPQPDDRHVVSL